MKKLLPVSYLFSIIFLLGCGSNDFTEKYRLNKKFWDSEDYKHVIFTIEYTDSEEKKPGYTTPEKLPIFKKLIDKNNISIVIEDDQLGIKHRAEFTTQMFDRYKDLVDLYSEVDREDNFVYPMEFVESLKFGLYLQFYYFNLNNEVIKKEADNPEARNVKDLIKSNQEILIGNYSSYLGYIKQENSLSKEALDSYIDGIEEYFPKVIEEFQNASFDEMVQKANNMTKKSESDKVKASLEQLLIKLKAEKK